ncbi:velvet factor-domain-containing protein [Pilaira anomala]|nr:velvet factor-domain-containing protein [Pilaira anomala]
MYKHNSDNQSLFMNQVKEDNLQRRRNSDIIFNNNDTSGNNNYIYTHPSQQLQQQQEHPQQQQNVLVNDANAIMSSFGSSQTPLASGTSHSNFKQTPRKEQDVFCELISLATKNNTNRHNMGSWQSHVNTNTIQYVPSYFTDNLGEASSSTQTQQQHQIPQPDNLKYYNSSLASANLAKAAAIKALAGPSDLTKKTSITNHTESDHALNGNERIYQLIIAQQPSRARMCGFGDKDRRPITPPPIVQLIVSTKYGQVVNPETFDISFLVVMCDSWQQSESEDGDESSSNHSNYLSQVISFPTTTMDEEGVETNSAIKMRNLVGSSVSSATKLYDLNGNLGIYFVFQDVSLRTEGRFRLKFSLVDVGSPYSHSVNTTSNSCVLKTIYTEPFTVYTAKKFPGVVQSTPLSKCFARQGIKIPIRKEKLSSTNNKKLANRDLETKLSDEDDYDDE